MFRDEPKVELAFQLPVGSAKWSKDLGAVPRVLSYTGRRLQEFVIAEDLSVEK